LNSLDASSAVLYRRVGDGRINLSSNELIHPDLPAMVEAAFQRLHPSSFSTYPRYDEDTAEIAGMLHLNVQEFILVPGTDSAIRMLGRFAARRRNRISRIILQTPNYYAWEQVARDWSVPLQQVTWTDIEAQGAELIAAASASSEAMIAFSLPNAPIGGCLTEAEVDRLIELARTRGHLVVIDCCYQAFNGPLRAHLLRCQTHVLVLQSLSKSHGLAGFRIGVLCGDPAIIAKLARDRIEHSVSAPAMKMAQAMLQQETRFARIWQDIRAVRTRTSRALAGLKFTPIRSGGNFITFRTQSSDEAAMLSAGMSDAGFRIKSFQRRTPFDTCLRLTVADDVMMGRAVEVLARIRTPP